MEGGDLAYFMTGFQDTVDELIEKVIMNKFDE